MDAERWSLVKPLFLSAVRLPPEARETYVDQACAGDRALRDEVRELLRADAVSPPTHRFPGAPSVGDPEPEVGLPASFGGFTLLAALGEGSYGRVYRARQDHPPREVAIKVIRGEAINADSLRRFDVEAEALARLSHPGIARIFEAGSVGGHPYIAMELVEGVPLTALCREGGPSASEKQRAALAHRVAEAVDHAHRQGVVHRDLKPANIMLDNHGQPRVLDFGVARLAGAHGPTHATARGAIIGTLQYLSPEQAAGEPGDTRSDVHALGVILFELLSQKPAFPVEGRTTGEALALLRNRSQPGLRQRLPACSRDLAAIVDRAAHPDPRHRYSSAGELAADLRRFLEDEPVLVRPPGPAEMLWRAARRHKVAAAAVALGLLGATLGAGAWAQGQRSRLAGEREARQAAAAAMRQIVRPIVPFAGSHESRRLLLAQLAPTFERFAAAYPRDPEVQGDFATFLELRADTELELGHAGRIRPWREQTLRIREQAAAASRGNQEAQRELATAMIKLGDVHKAASEIPAAIGLYQRAAKIQSSMLDATPDSTAWASDLAWSHQRLAEWLVRSGDRAGAQREQLAHLELSRRYVAMAPQSADAHRCLAAALIADGCEAFGRHGFIAAGERFLQAESHADAAARLSPGWIDDEMQMLSIQQWLVATELHTAGSDAADRRAATALERARALVAKSPGNAAPGMVLASLLAGRMQALGERGDWSEAALLAREAVPLCRSLRALKPEDPTVHRLLAASLHRGALSEARTGGPDSEAIRRSLAMYQESLALYESAAAQSPTDAGALHEL
ncbi:MAG: protein kinase domain-containing protein, partial [Phycisphaerales bacterium]